MNVTTTTEGNCTVVKVSGRFDFKISQEFRHAAEDTLNEPSCQEIRIDLEMLDYIDSGALGMLLALRERAMARGKTVSIAHPHGAVRQAIQIASFGKLFPIV